MKCIVCGTDMRERNAWLFNCPNCGFSASTLVAGSGRDVAGLETLRRKNFIKLLERLGDQYELAGKELLEVGCAEGWFLEEASRAGLKVSAIEPSSPHAGMARSNGFDVIEGFFPEDMPDSARFDFVVFNDVFEHLPDPVSAIADCVRLLRPGGALVINLPSNKGIIYRLATAAARLGRPSTLERLWQKDLPSPHLTYFNKETLRRFVSDNTPLNPVDSFSLDTVSSDGLLERIRVSHPGFAGRLAYAGIMLALPVFRFLPPDIIVGVFEKPHESMGE